MEVDQKVVATSVAASVAVHVHPLVIINISDHHTRLRAQNGVDVPVYGALLGWQDGRHVEIANSFELVVTSTPDGVIIDDEYLVQKSEQYKQVFKKFDVIGWYTSGRSPNVGHIAVHKQVAKYNETPLFILLDPHPAEMSREMPLHVYESYIDIADGTQHLQFIDTGYAIATEEAERIGVNHVATISTTETSSDISEVGVHLGGQYNAISMLFNRICVIKDYLDDVKRGALPFNHDIIRNISTLCSRLPAVDRGIFEQSQMKESNDILLISCLASITKGCNAMNEMLEKFNMVNARVGARRSRVA